MKTSSDFATSGAGLPHRTIAETVRSLQAEWRDSEDDSWNPPRPFVADIGIIENGAPKIALNLEGDCAPILSEIDLKFGDGCFLILEDLLEQFLAERAADMQNWMQIDPNDAVIDQGVRPVELLEKAFSQMAARCRDWLDPR